MYLVVDAGNTYVKFGLFRGSRLVLRITTTYDLLPVAGQQVASIGYERGLLISVAYELNDYILKHLPRTELLLPSRVKVPTEYSLTTLGPDRLAAAYPFIARGESAIVAVCGTAITVNVVKRGVFLGGPIFPSFSKLKFAYLSLSMMGRRLHPDSLKAIEDGIRYAILGGVREVMRDMERRHGIRRKFLTGGCAHELKVGGRIVPDLILLGGRMLIERI